MTNEPPPEAATPEDPTPEAHSEPAADDADRIPAVTAEWIAQPGDARRATLSALRNRRFWIRAILFGLVVGAIVSIACISTGSGWPLGLAIGGAFFAGVALEVILVCLFALYRQNRKTLRAGERWAAGSDDRRMRIDTSIGTTLITRENIVSVRRMGTVLVLRVRPKDLIVLPIALLDAVVSNPAFADLID